MRVRFGIGHYCCTLNLHDTMATLRQGNGNAFFGDPGAKTHYLLSMSVHANPLHLKYSVQELAEAPAVQ